ncbi:hypothetical protein N7466_009785 [Penicillium verhagenii]|uniref:uncharacterized protein n=1 Tax=Penicillium verhagenii TaxID=1562060 RepID=UPI0025454F67|nr:uncharacterized protein N7466_009785 [Penicillium verhagenii]KAJ5921459.1 hypothetical protein N7466_009785 [Penicillium verhagenii]
MAVRNANAALRIAVLECDHKLTTEFGSYGEILEKWLYRASHAVQHPLEIDAVLISGARTFPAGILNQFANLELATSVESDLPWIRKLLEFTSSVVSHARIMLVGICFGHQLVAKAIGGEVRQREGGFKLGLVPTQLSEFGKQLFEQSDYIPNAHDVVARPPTVVESTNVEMLGRSQDGDNHGFYAPKKLITLQGHPEFNRAIMGSVLEISRGDLGDAAYNEAKTQLHADGDGDHAARILSKVLIKDLM